MSLENFTTTYGKNMNNDRVDNPCQGCSRCCEWPGILTLTNEDEVSLACFLNLDILRFREVYTDEDGRVRLLRSKEDKTCVFLDEGSCTIYAARPKACREFPIISSITPSLLTLCRLAQIRELNTRQEKGGGILEESIQSATDTKRQT